LGLFEQAEQRLVAALAGAQRLQLSLVSVLVLVNLCGVRAHLGRFEEAANAGQNALHLARKQGDPRAEGAAEIFLSTNASLQGNYREAEMHALAGVRLLDRVPPLMPMAIAALAQSLLHQERANEAAVLAEKAFRILETVGRVEDGEALVRLVYAESLVAVGRQSEARAVIAGAYRRLQERAEAIREPAWREAFLTRLPSHAKTMALAAALAADEPRPAAPVG
jgi:hypothetical protein